MLIILALVGGILGGSYNKVSKPYFQTTMLLSSDYFNSRLVENSIDKLSSEILSKAVNVTKSQIGIITFLNDSSTIEFKYLDPQNIVSDKSAVQKTINSDFKFISKWMLLNTSSLLARNEKNNIARNLSLSTK